MSKKGVDRAPKTVGMMIGMVLVLSFVAYVCAGSEVCEPTPAAVLILPLLVVARRP